MCQYHTHLRSPLHSPSPSAWEPPFTVISKKYLNLSMAIWAPCSCCCTAICLLCPLSSVNYLGLSWASKVGAELCLVTAWAARESRCSSLHTFQGTNGHLKIGFWVSLCPSSLSKQCLGGLEKMRLNNTHHAIPWDALKCCRQKSTGQGHFTPTFSEQQCLISLSHHSTDCKMRCNLQL